MTQNLNVPNKAEEPKILGFIVKHFKKQNRNLNQISADNELLAQRLFEFYQALWKLKSDYDENIKILNDNQKIFQKQLRDFDTMMSFAWKADDMGIDTKSDIITFTKKKKLKYIEDYTIEFRQKLMESGKKIETLVLKKTKKEKSDGKK